MDGTAKQKNMNRAIKDLTAMPIEESGKNILQILQNKADPQKWKHIIELPKHKTYPRAKAKNKTNNKRPSSAVSYNIWEKNVWTLELYLGNWINNTS